MKKKTITLLFAVSTMLFGCLSHNYTDAPSRMGGMYSKYLYLGYKGEIRQIEEVGVVTTDGLIKFESIDGLPISSFQKFKRWGLQPGGRCQLHLLPGKHVLTMGFHDDRGRGFISWSKTPVTKILTLQKGQVIHLSLSENSKTWTAIESDGSSAFEEIKNDFTDLVLR